MLIGNEAGYNDNRSSDNRGHTVIPLPIPVPITPCPRVH